MLALLRSSGRRCHDDPAVCAAARHGMRRITLQLAWRREDAGDFRGAIAADARGARARIDQPVRV